MKKLSFLIAALCFFGLLLLPNSGFAELVPMSETQMRQITGQAGVSISLSDQLDLNMDIGTVSYGDTDGNGNGEAAYLSLNDVSIHGSAVMLNPVSIEITTKDDGYRNTVATGVDLKMDGMIIDIEKFKIGSITVGSGPGQGTSFGSISITDYHAEISGNVRISTF